MPYWDARFSDRPNILMRYHFNQGNQNYGANTSEVNMAVEIIEAAHQPSWGFNSGENSWSIIAAGQERSGNFTFDFRPSGLQSWYLWSGTITVTHDGNGNAYVGVGGGARAEVLGGAGIGNQGFWLSRIPKTPQPPTINEIVDVGTQSFGVRYSRGDNMGANIEQDHAQWSATPDFSQVVWDDYNPSGYTNPRGLGDGPGPLLNSNSIYWVRIRSRNSMGWGGWSGTVTGTTYGHPTAPRNLSASASTSISGRVSLSWTVPSNVGTGGVSLYYIYRDNALISQVSGSSTSFVDTGRTPYATHTYAVSALSSYSVSIGSSGGPKSSEVSVTVSGPPKAPRNLVAASNPSTPGRVDLTWDEPLVPGVGGITGYKVRRSEGTLVATLNGTGRSYTITGLTPGSNYSFYVTARNTLSDIEGTESPASNTASAKPIGEPLAPTNVTASPSNVVANRLTIQWSANSASLSGFNIFRRTSSGDVLLQKVGPSVRSFPVDNLASGTQYSYVVRGRTAYTDSLANTGYPGNWGGPASNVATGVPTSNATQNVPSLSVVSSTTNAVFAGSYVINSVTATSLSYQKTGPNIAQTISGGTIVNTTNTTFNGTFNLTAVTGNTLSYTKTANNVPSLPATGLVTNNTNTSMSGTFTVSGVNAGANLLSYNNSGSDVTSRGVPVNVSPGASSTLVNRSNAVFNATGKVILSSTATTLTYAQIASNVSESSAAGVVTNTTNKNIFNGVYTITSIPEYNVLKYAKSAVAVPLRTTQDFNGVVYRIVSPSTLSLHFRSGWAG